MTMDMLGSTGKHFVGVRTREKGYGNGNEESDKERECSNHIQYQKQDNELKDRPAPAVNRARAGKNRFYWAFSFFDNEKWREFRGNHHHNARNDEKKYPRNGKEGLHDDRSEKFPEILRVPKIYERSLLRVMVCLKCKGEQAHYGQHLKCYSSDDSYYGERRAKFSYLLEHHRNDNDNDEEKERRTCEKPRALFEGFPARSHTRYRRKFIHTDRLA